MDRIKRQIVKHLLSLLPEDRDHYRLDELRAFGFPDYLKQRIRVELDQKLSESVQMPETEWADMESEAVQALWVQLEHAVHQEAHLPASSAPSILNIIVGDVLNMLVSPREKLPEIIYGDEAELNYDQLIQRLEAVVVYQHFATLIPRYMQKKNVKKLSKERCAAIIERADERLTSRYTPLNWAQMLEPLFQLSKQKIDPELLTLFFEDKNKPRLAKLFDSVNAPVNRKELIELLSSPDTLEVNGGMPKSDPEPQEKPVFESKKNNDQPDKSKIIPDRTTDSEAGKQKPSKGDVSQEEDPIVGAFHKFRENLREKEGQGRDISGEGESPNGTSLNDVFLNQDEAENEDEESSPEEKPMSSEKPEAEDGFLDTFDEKQLESEKTETEDEHEPMPDDGSEVVESVFGQPDRDEETPMWKRFLSSEELASLEEKESPEAMDAALSPAQQEGSTEDSELLELREVLQGDQSFFTEELFRGSKEAYEKALKEIAGRDDWRSASKYISENVFKRNLVDMYSEAAVEFTDRLHAYFMEKSKS